MNPKDFETLSTERLVSLFAEICTAQYEAELDLDTRRLNRLFDQMMQVVQELKRRPGDGRSALSVLYTHKNIQVRLKAAIHTLAVHGTQARRVLAQSAREGCHPDGLSAIWRCAWDAQGVGGGVLRTGLKLSSAIASSAKPLQSVKAFDTAWSSSMCKLR
ncbi:DUF2019 domain-containing protein [Nitratireductor soli]|uniref:DUF2019 domain-containing protein n=1 Tax=Nitratireductor soli TaxID=1670619 RepID=UPI00065E156C|nr:DUF2019 domain-containing protein [Nitratireductor soli]